MIVAKELYCDRCFFEDVHGNAISASVVTVSNSTFTQLHSHPLLYIPSEDICTAHKGYEYITGSGEEIAMSCSKAGAAWGVPFNELDGDSEDCCLYHSHPHRNLNFIQFESGKSKCRNAKVNCVIV